MSRFVLTAQLQLQAPNNVQQVVRQLQQQLQGLTVNVQVQGTAQAQRQLQQVTNQTNAATSAADRMGRAFALSVRRFAALSVANRAVSLLTSNLSKAVDEAIQFERQLVKVAQVTGKSIAQLKGLTREITNLATGFGVASSDLLNVSAVLSQAGLSAQDTTVALRTLAKAALAPNFDSISETAEGAIAILAQFQEGVGALEKQLGSINAVAGAFAVEAGDLIDVVRRTGGVFKSSGGSLNELLALFTSVRATTRESAESIGTGLRTIFTRIQRPKTIEFLKQFGVELVDLNGKFVGPFEAIRRLNEALAGLGEGDISFIRIAEELGGFRQIGKVLPLIQQFSTAQAALNVAQKAGSSLTDDAAKAQLALAIRIAKVREEFLALIRSVTETTTFQVMANTALSLASALIKIGEAIKPLLPLLAAVAAVKFTQGIGTFIGGALRGATSGRAYSTGGKVHHFARGGFVPGTGNRDTVPAMLQPGEFVIRKSSVNKIGAGNLAAMNENKYAKGGKIQIKPGAIGGFFLQPEKGTDRPYKVNDKIEIRGTKALNQLGLLDPNDPTVRQEAFSAATKKDQENILYGPQSKLPTNQQKRLSKKASSAKSPENPSKNVFKSDGSFASGTGLQADPKSDARLTKRITSGSIKLSKDSKLAKKIPITGEISSYFPGADDMTKNAEIAQIISDVVSNGLENAVLSSAPQIASKFQNTAINTSQAGFNAAAKRIASDSNARKTTEGFVFEGAINAITGAQLSGNQENFDFATDAIRANRNALAAMFTNSSGEGINTLLKADAKRSNTPEALSSIVNKISNDINKGNLLGVELQKFAIGGEAQKVATSLGKGKAIADSWWTGMFAGNNILFDWGRPTVGFKIPTGEEIPIDQNLRKVLRDRAQREWLAFVDQRSKERDAKAPKTKTRDVFNLTPEQIEKAKKAAEAKKAQDYVNRTSGLTRDVEDYGRRKRRPEEYLKRMRGFATGGGVGTDTVPALLTPGEFVVNRSSAKKIGYGNLSRMNKVGKYAKGGVVQHFANGGTASGGGGGGAFGLDKFTTGLFAASTALSYVTPQITETSSSFEKGLANVINSFSSLLFTVTGVTGALAAFGISLSAKDLMNLFGKGPGSIGGILQNGIRGIFGGGQIGGGGPLGKGAFRAGSAVKRGLSSVGDKVSGLRGSINDTGIAKNINDAFNKGVDKLNKGFSAGLKGKSVIGGGSKSVLGNLGGFAGRATQGVKNFGSQLYDKTNLDLVRPSFNAGRQGKSLVSLTGNKIPLPARIGNAAGRFTNSQFSKGLGAGFTDKNLSFSKIFSSNRGILAKTGGVLGKSAGMATRGVGAVGGGLARLGGGALSKVASIGLGPAAAAAGVVQVLNSMVGSFRDLDGQLQKSIESGDELKSMSLAAKNAAASFPLIGNLIGGWNDGLDSALIGIQQAFGGPSLSSVTALAASQAGAVKTQKALEQAQKTATSAMEDFTNGNISASDALNQIRAATAEVSTQQKRAGTFAKANLENRAGGASGVGRNILSFLTFGGVESVSQRNSRLGKQSAEQINQAAKFQQEAFNLESPARQAAIRSGVARGKSPDEIRKEATGSLLSGIKSQQELGRQLSLAGDEEGSKAAFAAAAQMEEQLKQVNKEIANIEKEVKRQKELYNAMNLGLRSATSTASALSASLERVSGGFEVGGSQLVTDLAFLETALSSAAQAMNPDDIKKAVGTVSDTLREFGTSEEYIKKFEGNIAAFTQAQQNYSKAFDNIKKSIEKADFKNLSPEDLKKKLADELVSGLGPDVSDEAKKNLRAVVEGMELSEDETNKILGGDLSVIGDKLSEAQKKQIEDIQKIAAERQKAEQILIDFTKKRIEAERNFVEAQQQAIDLIMEGRDIQAKYGGAPVTARERTGAVLARSNAQSSRLGLTNLRTGDAGELRQRNAQISASFAAIEQRRRVEGGMQGRKGVEADEASRDLQKAQQEQVSTVRALIKIQEDELKIIQEKNKLERDSLSALVKGDVEAFFKQQSAVGAQAAIASGDTRLQSFYGAEALGMAFEDIKRQQEAGVQSIYGQQLAGPGGLSERAAGAALGARGVTDLRSAQVLAGTTGEEEKAKARLRELGGVLGETGELGANMAEMQVQTANIQVQTAELKFNEVLNRGNQVGQETKAIEERAATMNRGGIVYANRGIFVPRGTDTVPAMLTPGEFVVNRAAVQRGNNLQLLKAMNNGIGSVSNNGGGTALMARGGVVRYRANGSENPESGSDAMSTFAQALNRFNTDLNENITKLRETSISVKLDSTNVNVNLNNVEFLNQTINSIKVAVLDEVNKELKKMRAGIDGEMKENAGILNRSPGG